jgi:2-amino-4-hydroxy-6-hydroxymethyldihydropteridine diphosphokinase/dihydropteroate synthase
MGRVKVVDKGPRNIDLDILLYDGLEYSDKRLQIPHPLMFEREFVLRPLAEYVGSFSLSAPTLTPDSIFPYTELRKNPAAFPLTKTTFYDLRPSSSPSAQPMMQIKPLAPSNLSPVSSAQLQQETRIMSILNVTPDSFSDGGMNYDIDEGTLVEAIESHIADGATIIDVGGQSTRPGAVQVSAEEELARVLPVIRLLRSMPEANNVAISIDTYRASVAEAAIEAGANMINDVSAGMMDETMLPTMAKLGCTVCLMHMRGTPDTMNSLVSYPYGVVKTVARELAKRVRAAEEAGVRRWRIILDPGIGFAKTQEQNLELLRQRKQLGRYRGLEGIPWLVGTSRKAFIGNITGVKEAKERTWGTAVAVAAAIQGGADIVRVHDVKEMAQVAKMADALWRK